MVNLEDLIKIAKNARNNAYAPYSNFKVGCALLTKSGKIIDFQTTAEGNPYEYNQMVELFNMIKSDFDHMSNWIKNSTYLTGVLWGLRG